MSYSENMKHVTDGLSIGTVIATIAGWLPAIAALFTIIWTVIRIYETKTIQQLLKRGKCGPPTNS